MGKHPAQLPTPSPEKGLNASVPQLSTLSPLGSGHHEDCGRPSPGGDAHHLDRAADRYEMSLGKAQASCVCRDALGWERREAITGEHLSCVPQLPAAWSKPLPSLTGSAWSCPPVHVTCARPNPPNQCDSSRQCPPNHKCCQSSCGTRCITRPFFPSLSHGRVLGSHLPSPTSLGSRGGIW